MPKKLKKSYFRVNSLKECSIFLRYLIMLLLVLSLPSLYNYLRYLTIFLVYLLLSIFYKVSIINTFLLINSEYLIEIVPACIAGSAYLLIIILNLSVPLKFKKRIYSIIISFISLFIFNVVRIFVFSIMAYKGSSLFNIVHMFTWYFLSTALVILIWFFNVRIFSIKEVPFYSDFISFVRAINKP